MEIEHEVRTLREEVEALRLLLLGVCASPLGSTQSPPLCKATTAAGKACTHRAKPGGFCGMHGRPSQIAQKVPKDKKPRREVKKKPVAPVHSHGFGEPAGSCMICERYRIGGGWESL